MGLRGAAVGGGVRSHSVSVSEGVAAYLCINAAAAAWWAAIYGVAQSA